MYKDFSQEFAGSHDQLSADLERMTPHLNRLAAAAISGEPIPDGYVPFLGNNHASALHPSYYAFEYLKENGFDIHLQQQVYDHDGVLDHLDRYAVYVTPDDHSFIQAVMDKLYSSYEPKPQVPFSHFTSSWFANGLSWYSLKPELSGLDHASDSYMVDSICRELPEMTTDDGKPNYEAARRLYVKGYLSQVLSFTYGLLQDSRPLPEFTAVFTYFNNERTAYNELRAEGYSPIYFEEARNLTRMQLGFIAAHPEIVGLSANDNKLPRNCGD